MKRATLFLLLLFLLLLCTAKAAAQNCDSIVKAEIVDKIKNYSPEELLMYYEPDGQGDNWGYMSRDGKILTNPIDFYPSSLAFNPDAAILCGRYVFTIHGKDYSMEERINNISVASIDREEDENLEQGFTVNTENQLVSYSAIYGNRLYPFVYKGKTYAVAQLKSTSKYGVIDPEGNILEPFDFLYKDMMYIKNASSNDTLWLYFERDNGNTGCINLQGEIKCLNQFLEPPFGGSESRFYSIQNKDNLSGVFDTKNLKWTFKPQTKIKYDGGVFVGLTPETQKVYFVVHENKKTPYLVDLNGKAYKPRKQKNKNK
ncbi:MAG: hypothetical protein FWF52_09270 [Candidatus Azobacteroides sp.]|nr:hypothetical protein [Candidatus Azobacteroides sp.]